MKPITLVLVALAPFLAFADAVDGAPALVNVEAAKHRRALDVADSPWHRRNAKRQPQDGPPTIINLPDANPSPNQEPGSTNTTATDTSTNTSTSTNTTNTSTTPTDPTSTIPTSTSTTDTPTTSPSDTPSSTPDTPTSSTDPGGLLGGVTSLLGDVTSALGDVTSALGDTTSSTTPPDNGGGDQPTDTTTTTSSTDEPPPPPTSTSTTDVNTDTSISTTSTSKVVDIGDVFPSTTSGLGGVTETLVDSTTTKAGITIASEYQFITASSFVIAPDTSSTGTATATDPDAAQTTIGTDSNGAVTITAASIPSSIPLFITPPQDSDPIAPGTVIPGFTEISILFDDSVNWLFVLQSSTTAGQILGYMPGIIKSALGCSETDLITVGLKAFEPANMQSANDLLTMYVAQLRSDLVDTLSSLIKTEGSNFYDQSDNVARSITLNVVRSYNIASLSGVSNTDGSNSSNSSTTTVDNSRRNAIIGVSVAFGLIAFAVFGWWVWRTYKMKREGAHKRLSYEREKTYGTGAGGAGLGGAYGGYRADSPPMLNNPFMTEREREDEARGIRRNSFYAIGPDDASLEEDTFDYMSQRNSHQGSGGPGASAGYGFGTAASTGLRREGSDGSGRSRKTGDRLSPNYGNHPYARRPVVGQPISQPILRESSMGNW